MTHLLRAGDLIGHPVVSIATGEDIAEVRDVVYDADRHRLLGFTLNKRGVFAGRMKEVLAAEAVTGIGADALMVADDSAITDTAPGEEPLRHPKDASQVVGNRVVSSDGNALGEVVGVVLSTGGRPEAVGYEVEAPELSGTAFVPISDQMAVSGDNLLVPAESTEFIRNDLAGFGAAVSEYRQQTMPSTADQPGANS
ncbi:MAG: PRC-barrel domain-containing protein [Microthrixaceae bacterium]|nr:PRC-barrel domain-containing protein [Microthrixaceae bacterium]